MAGEEMRCAVRYDPKPLRGSLLTLTEQLWSALVDAQAAGLPASFRVGQNSAIVIGPKTFECSFRQEERPCGLFKLPSRDGGTAVEIGSVKETVLVKRNLEEERLRVRQRSQQAAEETRLRHSVVLDGRGRAVAAPARTSSGATARPSIPPKGLPGLQADVRQRGSSPAPASLESPPVPAAFEPRRSQSPAVAAQAAAPAPKKSAKSKLGLPRALSRPAAAATLPLGASLVDARVLAAARKGGVRLCLIALLAAKPLPRQGVEQGLAEAVRAVPGLRLPSGDTRAMLAHIADFRSPGRYHLRPAALRELEGLKIDEAPLPASDGSAHELASGAVKRQRSGEADEAPAGKKPMADKLSKVVAASSTKQRSKDAAGEVQPARQPTTVAGTLEAAAANSEPLALTTGHGLPLATPSPVGSSPAGSSAGSLPEPELPVHPDWLRAHHRPARLAEPSPRPQQEPAAAPRQPAASPACASPAVTATAASPKRTPSPRSLGRDASGRHGSSADGGGSGSRHGTSSSASRSSPAYDESWFAPHVSREPVLAAPIVSLEQFAAAKEEYNAKYSVYFRLHQEIQANTRDLDGLRVAAQAASSPRERKRWQAQLEKLWARREGRAARWSAAYEVLDEELASLKGAMRAYSLQQQARQPAPAPAGSDSRPIAAQ